VAMKMKSVMNLSNICFSQRRSAIMSRATQMSSSPLKPLKREYDYLALDDQAFEFGWDWWEVEMVQTLWKKEVSIWRIAERVYRDPDEVVVLVIDRARKGKIKERERGLLD